MSGYFWNGKEILTLADVYVAAVHKAGYLDMPCLDTACEDLKQRYGFFPRGKGWVPLAYENFPPEFRMHLLLLGVS